jgi:hypothetical protein
MEIEPPWQRLTACAGKADEHGRKSHGDTLTIVRETIMDSALVRSSPVRRVTSYLMTEIGTLVWSRDGQFVIFSAVDRNDYCILRVRVEGNRPPERIDMARSECRTSRDRSCPGRPLQPTSGRAT